MCAAQAGRGNLPVGAGTEAKVRVSFRILAIVGLWVGCGLAALAQTQKAPVIHFPNGSTGRDLTGVGATPAVAPENPAADNPVADPKAVVPLGNARFTVLTPQLIRMEWSADGKFEDHASFVFINRCLPVPKFESEVTKNGSNQVLTIKTSDLALNYYAHRRRSLHRR